MSHGHLEKPAPPPDALAQAFNRTRCWRCHDQLTFGTDGNGRSVETCTRCAAYIAELEHKVEELGGTPLCAGCGQAPAMPGAPDCRGCRAARRAEVEAEQERLELERKARIEQHKQDILRERAEKDAKAAEKRAEQERLEQRRAILEAAAEEARARARAEQKRQRTAKTGKRPAPAHNRTRRRGGLTVPGQAAATTARLLALLEREPGVSCGMMAAEVGVTSTRCYQLMEKAGVRRRWLPEGGAVLQRRGESGEWSDVPSGIAPEPVAASA